MNRRSFLRILPAMAALGTWIKVRPSINPAWINAPYEAHFMFSAGSVQALANADSKRLAGQIAEFCARGDPYSGIMFGVDPHPLRVKL